MREPHMGWCNTSLGACCSLRGDTVDPARWPDLRYVGLEHLDSGSPLLLRWGRASEVSSTKARFQSGDVLFGKLRPNLKKSALALFAGVCSTDILVFKMSPGVDATYLSYLAHSTPFTEHAIRSVGGVNLPRTSWSALREFKFGLPPLAEQRAVAAALSAVQDARDNRRRELDAERERKAALMEDLFSNGVRGESCQQIEVGAVPQSWQVKPLGEVADIIYGVQAAVAHLRDSACGIPILTNINITNDGIIDLTTLRYYELPENKQGALTLQKGDLLFNWRSGSESHVGKTALFDLDGNYTFSSFILRFRTREGTNNVFLRYYLHLIRARGFFTQKRQQSSVNSVINASVAATIPVALPDMSEQREIAEALTACDEKIAALEAEAVLHDELFRALLDDLMTGRVSALQLVETETQDMEQIGV